LKGKYSKCIGLVVINDDGDCLSPEEVRHMVAKAVEPIYRVELDKYLAKYYRAENSSINFLQRLPSLNR
jgi:hypothetical protein